MRFSLTQLERISCPQRFRWQVVEGWEPTRRSEKVLKGSACHEGWKVYYAPVEDRLADMQAAIYDTLSANEESDDLFAKKFAEAYHRFAEKEDNFEIVSQETRIDNPDWPCTGKPDMLIKSNDQLLVMEFKTTSQSLSTFLSGLYTPTQTIAYAGMAGAAGYVYTIAHLPTFAFLRPPPYLISDFQRKYVYQQLALALERAEYYATIEPQYLPANWSSACFWQCWFYEVCKALRTGFDYQHVLLHSGLYLPRE